MEATYHIHRSKQIAIVRVSDTVVQGWKAQGKKLDEDFEHSHFQTTYPDKARLDEYLADFEPSTVDEYVAIQFEQHHLDDHYRTKANDWKQRQFEAAIATGNTLYQRERPTTPPPSPTSIIQK